MAVGLPLGTVERVKESHWEMQRLLESLWAILKGYRKPAGKCPNTCCQPIGKETELPSSYWQKSGNLYHFSLKCCISVYFYKKSKELWEIFKMLSGSSLIFALSNHTTFSQTQSCTTFPLKLQTKNAILGIFLLSLFRFGFDGFKLFRLLKSTTFKNLFNTWGFFTHKYKRKLATPDLQNHIVIFYFFIS